MTTTMPIYNSGNFNQAAIGVVALDTNGNPAGNSAPSVVVTASSGQLAGTAINLASYSGVKLQIAGLSADSIAITHSMDGTNYVTATLLKYDLTTVAASAMTGSSANGIYSVMGFGGNLKIIRTGSADTLSVMFQGTN